MSYLLILLLASRVFISEQVSEISGIMFNLIFCIGFLLQVFFVRNIKIRKPLLLLLILLPLSIYLSNIFSINSFNSERELLNFCTYILIFVFVTLIKPKQRSLLLKSVIFTALVVGLRALYQYFFTVDYIKDHFSYQEITRNGFYALELLKQRRIVSWFTSPNLLAGYLISIIPVCTAFFVDALKKKNRPATVLYAAICLILFMVVILTKSIGAYLSFIIAMGFFLVMLSREKAEKTKFKSKVFLIFFLTVFFIFGGILLNRSKNFLNTKNPQNSFVQRINYWQTAFKMIQEHPLKGIGAGNFGIVYPRFKDKEANETTYAHNSYLQLWAESGLLSLILLLLWVWFILIRVFKIGFNRLSCGIVAGFLAFLIHNVVDYTFFVPQVSYLWWILLAYVADADNSFEIKSSDDSPIASSVLRLCCLGFGLLLLYNNFLEYNSQLNIDKALVLFQKRDFKASNRAALDSLRYKPNNDFAYYIMAHNFQNMKPENFSEKVLENYKKAISLNSRYAFYYYEAGKYLLEHHQKKKAKHFLAQAINLYPQNPKFLRAFYSN